jgi:predicted dienelactone hydrolase
MPVGFKSGLSFDISRTNWDGSGPRPLAWSAWYPAQQEATEALPAQPSWFKASPVAHGAAAQVSATPLSLVLLSHGSGASGMALEWLAHQLAQKGFVALAIDHHGHTSSGPYRAEGFLCLWERARDFSALLDDAAWRAALEQPVAQGASVIGFSAGAYTAMMLAGARVAYSQFEPDNPVRSPVRGPREFPNLADGLPELLNKPVFRQSWDRRRNDYADARIAAATAIAPGRSVLGFAQESLRAIQKPVQIIGGAADITAPPAECCNYLHDCVSGSTSDIVDGAGHYTFLPQGSETGKTEAPELFYDGSGVQRQAVHEHVAMSIADFVQSVRERGG